MTPIGCDAGDPSSATRRADRPEILRVCPAVFAVTVAITRFSIGGLRAAHAQTVLLAGALGSAAGAATIAAAPNLFVAAFGLALAAAGTAVLFPTLLGIVSLNVDETHRGRATSIVTTVSYVGFLLGPVYVGLLADAPGLRGAVAAVAALAVALFILTPALLRLSGFGRPASQSHATHAAAASSNNGEQPVHQILYLGRDRVDRRPTTGTVSGAPESAVQRHPDRPVARSLTEQGQPIALMSGQTQRASSTTFAE